MMIYEISRLYALNSMVDQQPKKERKKERLSKVIGVELVKDPPTVKLIFLSRTQVL